MGDSPEARPGEVVARACVHPAAASLGDALKQMQVSRMHFVFVLTSTAALKAY